jgi:hypothetical protein
MQQSVARRPGKPVDPHYVNPKIVQTPTPKTDAAVQTGSKMYDVSPDKIITHLTGTHINLSDLEKEDTNPGSRKFGIRPYLHGHSALGVEYHAGNVRGYIQHVKVAHDYGKNVQKPNSFVINSTEMQDGSGQSQEVVSSTTSPSQYSTNVCR